MNKKLINILGFLIVCITFNGHLFAEGKSERAFLSQAPSIEGPTSFAVIIDSTTFVKVGSIILKYCKTIESDGLPTYLIIGNWTRPEQVREVIIKLYQQKKYKLEGFVFIGDIPIVMLQDAQHLTSAFRMNPQERTMAESSVPSDRYYDDLDLQCELINRDSTNRMLFYYRLLPESPVKLNRDLYSARIPVLHFSHKKYRILRQYFKKVIQVRSAPLEPLDRIITLNGFNYISDSHTAILDEIFTLRQIFNLSQIVNSRIHTIFHKVTPNPKLLLFHKLKSTDSDLLIIHSHGNESRQFLQENQTNPLLVDENISSVHTMPDSNGENSISLEEINKQKINTELVILDVCYNGAFQLERYMAAAYLFTQGQVLTVMANSVNVRQDLAIIENLGALGVGARIGEWHQAENYLESHLFGDPTFRFASVSDEKYHQNPPFERLPAAIDDLDDYFKKSRSAYIRASALAAMHQFKVDDWGKYLEHALKDPANIVRLKAWMVLASERSARFIQILPEGLNDSYELIRRYCAMWMGEVGANSFVQHLAQAAVNDPSERVLFNALISLKLIGTTEARTALKWILSEISGFDGGKFIQQARANLITMSQWLPNDVIPPLTGGTDTEKIKHIRLFRANHHQLALPYLIFLFENDENPEIQMAAAEAIGWYSFYEKRDMILEMYDRVLQKEKLDKNLRKVAELARRRMVHGPNRPNTP